MCSNHARLRGCCGASAHHTAARCCRRGQTSCRCTPGVEGGGADRTGGGWAEVAGRVDKRRKRKTKRKRKVNKSYCRPSSSRAVRPWKSGHSSQRALRLWQSCPVFGCCFDSGYMYMRRYWRHFDYVLVFTHRWTSDQRSILQAIWTLCRAPCWQLAVRCLSCLRSI